MIPAQGNVDIDRLVDVGWVTIPGLYIPSKWQQEFHGLKVDEALGGGSAGPGKTQTLLFDFIPQVIVEHERCRRGDVRWGESVGKILFLRRELGMLEETLSRAATIFHRIDPKVKQRDDLGKPTFTFASGMKVIFGGCKDKSDYRQYQGAQYTAIYYDELWQFEEEQYHQINTRLRTSDRLLMRMQKIRSATNPEPNWVRKYFVDPEPRGRKILKQSMRSDRTGQTHTVTRLFLPATLYDNPDPQFVADYERRLMNKPAHVRAAMMYGDWYASAGAFYEQEWRRDRHVILPFEIPAGWTVFRSMDWGYKTHGVVLWWAVTPDNDMIAVDEMSFRYATATDVAKRIREIERKRGWWSTKAETGGRSKLTGPADTQLWEERGETAVSKAEEMARVGVRWQRANKKSRQNNAERFITRLRDLDGDIPGICFMDRCKESIRTIPSIRCDDNNPNEPKKGDDDHWHDAVLYACAYRASPGTDSIKPRDEDDDDKPKRRDRKRGAYGYGM